MPVSPLKVRFGQLIRSCLQEKGIRQKELAKALNISGSAVSQITKGKLVPDASKLAVICELCRLKRDQIFELESLLSRIRSGGDMRSPFNQAIFVMRCNRGLSYHELANRSGIPAHLLEILETSFEAKPTVEQAEKLSAIFDCSPRDLLHTAGVGGYTDRLFEPPEADGMQEIPLLDLPDLAEFQGGDLMHFAASIAFRATKIRNGYGTPRLIAVNTCGRDLELGIPGVVQLHLTPDELPDIRKVFLCRFECGGYILREQGKQRVKQFRLAGTRKRVQTGLLWQIPVLNLSIDLRTDLPVGESKGIAVASFGCPEISRTGGNHKGVDWPEESFKGFL